MSGNKPADESVKRPPLGVCDAHALVDYGAHVKYPGCENWRPIEPSAPAAPANALRSEWQSRLQLLQSLELGVYSELSPADRDTVKTWLVDVQVRLALLDVPPDAAIDARLATGERGIPKIPDGPDTRHAISTADNAGRCAHGDWLADHCHECAKIIAAESAAVEEAVRLMLQLAERWTILDSHWPDNHYRICADDLRRVAALVAEGWGKAEMSKKPKFRVGQVVFWRGDNECYPFKIDRIEFDLDSQEHVYWSCDSEHLEKELRPLTKRERGAA